MTKIEGKIIKHSKCPRGHELITYELVFPRFLLAELNTHRMFSKNSASSRAIPFKKMVEMVQNDPFIPIAWQKEHKGMQGSEYLTGDEAKIAELRWLQANVDAVHRTQMLNLAGVTKQLCNRLLEPFMWHKVVLTTGLEGLRNFFELRCPAYDLGDCILHKSKKDALVYAENELNPGTLDGLFSTQLDWLRINKGQAEIHMMELAEQMYDTYSESVPQLLNEGEWHIPYKELIDMTSTGADFLKHLDRGLTDEELLMGYIKASTGMLARASYITIGDDKVPSIETLIGIHDKMVNAIPKHSSPMEHCSRVMTEYEYDNYIKGFGDVDIHSQFTSVQIFDDESKGWCRNYRGFIQYRQILEENEKL